MLVIVGATKPNESLSLVVSVSTRVNTLSVKPDIDASAISPATNSPPPSVNLITGSVLDELEVLL